MNFNQRQKHNGIYQKVTKKIYTDKILKQNSQINSKFFPDTNLKIGTYVLIPIFTKQKKRISKKLQPLRKGPYQIIDKPSDVTYKLTDLN